MITLITSNEEIDDIMKAVKFFEESGLLILGTLGAGLLGNMLVGKKQWQKEQVKKQQKLPNTRKKQVKFLIPPHSLTNFEIQKYGRKKTKFNSAS